ncbi:MAG: sulfite exporter TauE/SafE family protein [Actinomycetota bacterium]|nr:sulfite exporter TauE/SafE family protein [Actinomycetota bacterium]
MEPGLVRDALAIVVGFAAGMLSGAIGVGGAVITTPGIRLLGASAFVAVGTTLPSILPGAVAGTARYAREGLVDWGVVAAAAPAGVVAAVAGSLASHSVPGDGHWLMVLTAVLVGVTAVRMLRPPDEDDPPVGRGRPRSRLRAAGVGGAAGLLSGLLGVGGGIILVPGLSQVVGLELKATVATSLACVGILAVPSTVTHAALGDIDWRLALLLAVAVVPGARVGAALSIRARERRLRLALGAFLAVVAVGYGVSELTFALR